MSFFAQPRECFVSWVASEYLLIVLWEPFYLAAFPLRCWRFLIWCSQSQLLVSDSACLASGTREEAAAVSSAPLPDRLQVRSNTAAFHPVWSAFRVWCEVGPELLCLACSSVFPVSLPGVCPWARVLESSFEQQDLLKTLSKCWQGLFLLSVGFVSVWGLYLAMFGTYSWLYAQRSLLAVSGGPSV